MFSNQVEQYGHNFLKYYKQIKSYLMCLFSEQAYQQYQKYNFGRYEVLSLYSEQYRAFTILLAFNTPPHLPKKTQPNKQTITTNTTPFPKQQTFPLLQNLLKIVPAA